MDEEIRRNEDHIDKTLRQLLEELKNAKSEEEIELIEKKIELLEDMIEEKGHKKKVEFKTENDAQEVKEIMDALAESLPKIMDSLMGPLKELLNELYDPEKAEMLGKNIATFYKEMVAAGMEPDKAFELTKNYMESINVVKSLLEAFVRKSERVKH